MRVRGDPGAGEPACGAPDVVSLRHHCESARNQPRDLRAAFSDTRDDTVILSDRRLAVDREGSGGRYDQILRCATRRDATAALRMTRRDAVV
jgi:hypothetical protein